MKNILLISLLFSLGLGLTGCDDNKDEYLSDYSTILYFRDSGEIDLTLYKTGEDANYQLTVNKSGSELNSVTEIEVGVLNEASLTAYNEEYETSYVKMPDNCYLMEENHLIFGAEDLYKPVHIVLKTDLIHTLPTEKQYVLPIYLYNTKDSINTKKDKIILKPSVIVPSVSLDQTGYFSNVITDKEESQLQFILPVSLLIDNVWTFDCKIKIDETLLDEYNKKNGANYTLLPTNAYDLSNNGIVPFIPGTNSTDLEIIVDRTKLEYGNYLLPLRLTECTQAGFIINPNKETFLYGVAYMKNVNLTVDMLSTNAPEPKEGSLANLLDGDVETYFHSAYSVAVDGHHYLQVELPTESTAMCFNYTTRSAHGNGNPTEIIIEGSMDGINFTLIDTLNDGLPTGGKENYHSPVLMGQPFKIVRFTVTRNVTGGSYFVWSEFGMKII